jgi:hypothetical protein
MVTNEGAVDRAVRIGIGLLLVAVVFLSPQWSWLGVVGVILLMTGLAGHCPLYHMLGIRTCGARP